MPGGLNTLFFDGHVKTYKNGLATVTGVTLRGQDARPGDLFAALAGGSAHGAAFAADAVQRGAVAVLTDRAGADLLGPDPGVPVLVHPDPRAVLGAVAAQVYGRPSDALTVIGVTGTSGKTTTTYLIEAGLRAAGRVAGLIGTVGVRIDGADQPSALTTTPTSASAAPSCASPPSRLRILVIACRNPTSPASERSSLS